LARIFSWSDPLVPLDAPAFEEVVAEAASDELPAGAVGEAVDESADPPVTRANASSTALKNRCRPPPGLPPFDVVADVAGDGGAVGNDGVVDVAGVAAGVPEGGAPLAPTLAALTDEPKDELSARYTLL